MQRLLTARLINGVIEAYKAKLSEENSEGQMAADLAAKAPVAGSSRRSSD